MIYGIEHYNNFFSFLRLPNNQFVEDYFTLIQEHCYSQMLMFQPNDDDIRELGIFNDGDDGSEKSNDKLTPMLKLIWQIKMVSFESLLLIIYTKFGKF